MCGYLAAHWMHTCHGPPVASLGSGSELWRVDVVLCREGVTEDVEALVLEVIESALSGTPDNADEEIFTPVASTYSFDMEPPGGSVGVSCWVRADTAGEATQVGFDAVRDAVREVTGRALPLWDLRLVPRTAMVTREEAQERALLDPGQGRSPFRAYRSGD